jgi:hypothetical protein
VSRYYCKNLSISWGVLHPDPDSVWAVESKSDPGSTKRPKKAKKFDEALRMISLEASAGDSILIKKQFPTESFHFFL